MNVQEVGVRLFYETRGVVSTGLDLLDIARMRFTNPHRYTKFLIIRSLSRRTRSDTLIETGTYTGVMAYYFSFQFDRVYTIELDPRMARRASQFLACRKNVSVLQGDVEELLEPTLQNLPEGRVLLFLDAHYCGEETARGEVSDPIIQELEVASRYLDKIGGIVIDDFRTFGTEPDTPSKSSVLNCVEQIFPNEQFDTRVHLDQIIIARRADRRAR